MRRPRVRECMTREPVTLHVDDRLREAVELVLVRRIRHIPVLDEHGTLAGIVTDRDIKRTLPSPLSSAAREEYEAILETTAVGHVMSKEPITIDADADVSEAVRILVESRVGGLPVLEGGALVGIFTERDALRAYLDLLRVLDAVVPAS